MNTRGAKLGFDVTNPAFGSCAGDDSDSKYTPASDDAESHSTQTSGLVEDAHHAGHDDNDNATGDAATSDDDDGGSNMGGLAEVKPPVDVYLASFDLSSKALAVIKKRKGETIQVKCPGDFIIEHALVSVTTPRGKISKISKFDCICIICADTNAVRKLCSSSNMSKHYNLHKEKLSGQVFTVQHIVELKGTRFLFAKDVPSAGAKLAAGAGGKMGLVTGSVDEYQNKVVQCLVRSGRSLSMVELPAFRQMIEAARNAPKAANLTIRATLVRKKVLAQFEVCMRNMAEEVASNSVLSFSLVFDAWDYTRYKYMGACIRFVTLRGNKVVSRVCPIMLVVLRGHKSLPQVSPAGGAADGSSGDDEQLGSDGESGDEGMPLATIESADDIVRLVRTKLVDLGIPRDKLLCASGDGAPNAVKAAHDLTLASPLVREAFEVDDWPLFVPACLTHTLGLCLKYVLGMVTVPAGTVSEIPHSAGTVILEIVAKARKIAQFFLQAKRWAQLEQAAAEQGMPEVKMVSVDMDVRWMSTYLMLSSMQTFCIAVNHFVAKHKDTLDEDVVEDLHYSPSDRHKLHCVVAVLRPLGELTKFCDTTRVPLGAYALPLILHVLNFYGVNVAAGILDQDAVMQGADAECSFLYRNLETGVLEPKAPDQLTNAARTLVDKVRQHLHFRLVHKRANLNVFNLLATYLDPLAAQFFTHICGSATRAASIEAHLKAVVSKLCPAASRSGHAPAHEAAGHLPDKSPSIFKSVPGNAATMLGSAEDEFTIFRRVGISSSDHGQLSSFMRAVANFSPFEFWSQTSNQKSFPSIFKAARHLLSLGATSILQESVFSSAGDTLASRRCRLVGSPKLIEALVLYRYTMALEKVDGGPRPSEPATSSAGSEQVMQQPAKKQKELGVIDLLEE